MHYTQPEVYEFISKQTNDPIVERKACRVSGEKFAIYQSDVDFYSRISPTFDWKKFHIPTPTLCQEERMRRRLMFRNERKLYRRECNATQKSIISMYSPDKDVTVYDQGIWRWDQRDWKEYSGTFSHLLKTVPKFSVLSIECENSMYANHVLNLKDCYLCYSSLKSSGCLYCWWAISSESAVDCTFIKNCTNCFELVKCSDCYACFYCNDCYSCVRCSWCEDCEWCEDCFWCKWLRNQKFCIGNKQYTKDQYQLLLSKIKHKELHWKELLNWLWEAKDWLYTINSENCIWNNISNSKNCLFVCDFTDSSDSKYSFDDWYQESCFDVYGGSWSQYCYELMSYAESTNCAFWVYWIANDRVYYCSGVYYSKDCFMCVWLRNVQYCVLNKQYPNKETYEKAVAVIIEKMIDNWSWWEFFAPSLSAFGYNESIAMDYYPLSIEQAKSRWYKRSEYDDMIVLWENASVIDIKLFDNDSWIELGRNDDLFNKIFLCEESGKPFRLVKQELQFYKKHGLEVPRRHPDIRHKQRMQKRPWRVLKKLEEGTLTV